MVDVSASADRAMRANAPDHGLTPRELFGNLLGRVTGPTRGRDANLHGVSALDRGIIGFISHLPQSLPVALGVAMSFRYRSESRVAMAFTGDGASNSGLYHEVLNMAALSLEAGAEAQPASSAAAAIRAQ